MHEQCEQLQWIDRSCHTNKIPDICTEHNINPKKVLRISSSQASQHIVRCLRAEGDTTVVEDCCDLERSAEFADDQAEQVD